MDGINVLNKEEILVGNDGNLFLFIMSVILVVILLIVAFNCHYDIASFVCGFAALFCAVSAIVNFCIYCAQTEPTGRYRYEVTIDKSVSITDVYDNYNVIEQRGEIWVLEDKEE